MRDVAIVGAGQIHLDLCLKIRCIAFSVVAPLRRPALAVDQRLKFSRGVTEMQRRGARLEIAAVSVEALERIAADHDLTVVTVGHRSLGSALFERDAARCVYERPRRRLFMLNIESYNLDAGVAQDQLKFSFIPPVAEIFWVPFYDVDAGVSKSIVIESVPGGPADRFGAVRSADEGLDVLKDLVRTFLERIRDRGEQSVDPEWLAGQFDDFWEYSRYVNDFSNALLEPLRGFQRNLLISASRRPDIAEEIRLPAKVQRSSRRDRRVSRPGVICVV